MSETDLKTKNNFEKFFNDKPDLNKVFATVKKKYLKRMIKKIVEENKQSEEMMINLKTTIFNDILKNFIIVSVAGSGYRMSFIHIK